MAEGDYTKNERQDATNADDESAPQSFKQQDKPQGQSDKTTETEKKPGENKRERFRKFLKRWEILFQLVIPSIFSAAVIIVIVVQASIYSRQLTQMKKATKAATGATDLSRRSLEQIERNTHLDQRAWVTVRGAILTKQLATGEKVVVKLEIINSGKTPALETETAGVVSERPDTPRVDPTLPATVSSRGVVGPGVVVTTEFESKVPITKDDIDWIQMGLNYIYVNGLIIYNDVFGQKHRTEFCFKISQKELQTQPFLMTDCDVGNTAD